MRPSRSWPLGLCPVGSLLLLGSCGGGSDGASPPFTPTEGVEITNTTAQVSESDGVVSIAFGLPEALTEDVLVELAVSGSAASPEDFALASLQVPIPAGALEAGVDLTLIDDSLFEADETIILTIAGVTPAGAVDVGPQNEFTLTVLDNDTAPSVSFGVPTAQVAEAAGSISIPIQLSEVSGVGASVDVARSGTAGAADYSLLEDTITIPAGSTSANVVLTASADGLDEGTESAILTLTSPAGATLGAETVATVEITDSAAPDGWGGIVYARLSATPEESGVFTSDFAPATPLKLTEDFLSTTFYTLSQDRDRIAYTGVELFPPSAGLFLADASGASIPLTSGQLPTNAELRWSPDDRWIAFFARPGQDLDEEVFVTATDGSGTFQITSAPIIDVLGVADRLQWSPDSTRLAFSAAVKGGTFRLFTANPDGTGRVDLSGQLGEFASVQEKFAWSPDGSTLAFRSGSSLYTVPGAGGSTVLITDQLQSAEDEPDFAWAAGSSRLVYRALDTGVGIQLFSCQTDGSGVAQVSTGALRAEAGWRVAPDGQRVAYFGADAPQSGIELRVAAVDGSLDLLAGGSLPEDQEVTSCSWSPTSDRVAYRQNQLLFSDLLAAAADGSGFVSIAETAGPEDFFSSIFYEWAPDGSRVSWIGIRVTPPISVENYLASNAATGGDKQVHSGPYDVATELSIFNFKWTLDSSGLVFAVLVQPDTGELRGVRVDGSAPESAIPGTNGVLSPLASQYDVR